MLNGIVVSIQYYSGGGGAGGTRDRNQKDEDEDDVALSDVEVSMKQFKFLAMGTRKITVFKVIRILDLTIFREFLC